MTNVIKTVNIYTDGACSGNQNEENFGGWGAILDYGDYKKEAYGGEANTTNNRMELTALTVALEMLKTEMYSDRHRCLRPWNSTCITICKSGGAKGRKVRRG